MMKNDFFVLILTTHAWATKLRTIAFFVFKAWRYSEIQNWSNE